MSEGGFPHQGLDIFEISKHKLRDFMHTFGEHLKKAIKSILAFPSYPCERGVSEGDVPP